MSLLDHSYPASYTGDCPVCGGVNKQIWNNTDPHIKEYRCLHPDCEAIFIDRSPVALPVPDPAEDDDVEGVWVIVDRDYFEYIGIVFPDEVSALRALNGRGYGRVAFVPYGKEFS